MTDIFRQELDIPEKPKTFGWIFLVFGGTLLVLAIVTYLQERSFLDRYDNNAPHVVSPTSYPAALSQMDKSAKLTLARQYLWTIIVAFGLVMVFVLGAIFSHRIAWHLGRDRTPTDKTKFYDPWQESGQKMPPPPQDE